MPWYHKIFLLAPARIMWHCWLLLPHRCCQTGFQETFQVCSGYLYDSCVALHVWPQQHTKIKVTCNYILQTYTVPNVFCFPKVPWEIKVIILFLILLGSIALIKTFFLCKTLAQHELDIWRHTERIVIIPALQLSPSPGSLKYDKTVRLSLLWLKQTWIWWEETGNLLTFLGQFGHTWVGCFWRRGRAASIIDELNLKMKRFVKGSERVLTDRQKKNSRNSHLGPLYEL